MWSEGWSGRYNILVGSCAWYHRSRVGCKVHIEVGERRDMKIICEVYRVLVVSL